MHAGAGGRGIRDAGAGGAAVMTVLQLGAARPCHPGRGAAAPGASRKPRFPLAQGASAGLRPSSGAGPVLAILPMLALKKGCAWVRVAPVPASPLLRASGRSDNPTFAGTGRGTAYRSEQGTGSRGREPEGHG